LGQLERLLNRRIAEAPPGSYTARLADDEALRAAKLVEEAGELGRASTPAEVVWEAADLLYFTVAALAARGLDMAAVMAELDRRRLAVRRRDGSRTFKSGEDA
jgi:phosphoribosyl-ATP pyrophosphohydrolase